MILQGVVRVKIKAFNTAVAALALIAAPTIAAAQPIATPLTQPAQQSVDGDSALRGGGSGFFVFAIAIVFIGLGIYAAVDSDDEPNSPG